MEINLVGGISISREECTIVLIDHAENLVHQTRVTPSHDAIKKVLQPYSSQIKGLAICGSNAHGGLAEYLIDSGYKTYLVARSMFSQQAYNTNKQASCAAVLLREKLVTLVGNVNHNKSSLPKLLGKSVLSDLHKLPITTFLTRL